VFIPTGSSQAQAAALRREGYATVAALTPTGDDLAEAARVGCTFVLSNDTVRPLIPETRTGD
jgi:hypothetical protein